MALLSAAAGLPSVSAQSAEPAGAVVALPSVNVPAYMGTWYQVAWIPNRFQKQCVSDTVATYKQLPGGAVEVTNRCRLANGKTDDVVGLARPSMAALRGDQLEPAQLEVSFLPRALRWLPIWGSYWVLKLAPDGRYAVVGEPSRDYLWVLSRTPSLLPQDEAEIRAHLVQQGYDLSRLQAHGHTASPAPSPAPK